MSAGFQIGSGREQATHSRRYEFLAGLDWTIERARRSLLALQHSEGYWNAPLEAPAQMNAEFIIFNHFMDSVDRGLEARDRRNTCSIPSSPMEAGTSSPAAKATPPTPSRLMPR